MPKRKNKESRLNVSQTSVVTDNPTVTLNYKGLNHKDFELLFWFMISVVIGVGLGTNSAAAFIVTAITLLAIGRLIKYKPNTDARNSFLMVPLVLLGYIVGLLLKAIVS